MSYATIENDQPRALTVSGFLQRYGIGRDLFYAEVKAGRIKLRKVGHRSLIGVEDAEKWFESLPISQPKPCEDKTRL